LVQLEHEVRAEVGSMSKQYVHGAGPEVVGGRRAALGRLRHWLGASVVGQVMRGTPMTCISSVTILSQADALGAAGLRGTLFAANSPLQRHRPGGSLRTDSRNGSMQ
jgi:hypothetical protein